MWECDPLFVAQRGRSDGATRYPDFVGEKGSSEARRRSPAAPQKPNIGGNNETLAELPRGCQLILGAEKVVQIAVSDGVTMLWRGGGTDGDPTWPVWRG